MFVYQCRIYTGKCHYLLKKNSKVLIYKASAPGREKNIAESKGIYRGGNLKEASCREHTNPRAKLWSNEQKSY